MLIVRINSHKRENDLQIFENKKMLNWRKNSQDHQCSWKRLLCEQVLMVKSSVEHSKKLHCQFRNQFIQIIDITEIVTKKR